MSKKSLSKADQPQPPNTREQQLGEDDFIVSKTDRQGRITYVNQIFMRLAGYSSAELIGANHNLIRHPEMPKVAFKIAWERIQKKKEFFGFIKNLCADGSYYWVYAYITADTDSRGEIIGFTSIRRRPPQSAIDTIIPIYKRLLDSERHGGVQASEKVLSALLDEKSMTYDEFIINTQKDIKV